MINTGISGLYIEVGHDHVYINERVKLLKPEGVSATQWVQLWERLDKDHAREYDTEGGCIIVHLDQ